ncbi:MAG: hypothetical protein AAB851_03145 [Patescibacteria group bacterium]
MLQSILPYFNIAKDFLRTVKIRFSASVMAGQIVLVILSVGAVDYFLTKQVDGLALSLSEKRSLLKVWLERDNTAIQLRRDYEIVKDAAPKIGRPLPTIETFGVFITEIENLAAASNVAQTISFSEPQQSQTENILVVPFSIILSGATYDAVLNYIRKFENMPYFAEIEMVGFSSSAGIFTPGQATLTAKAYIRK